MMSNAQINATFLKTIARADKDYVLSNIAKHYGCTREEALAEVLDDDAEHLLDYMVGPARWTTQKQMHEMRLLQSNH